MVKRLDSHDSLRCFRHEILRDIAHLRNAADGPAIEWRFLEGRLSSETAGAAHGCASVCAFVNDKADRACIMALKSLGVRHIALRCAGFNGVDVEAAREADGRDFVLAELQLLEKAKQLLPKAGWPEDNE